MMQSYLDDLWPDHEQRCGKSFILKASYIRNLFHEDRRMENSIAKIWRDGGHNIKCKRPDKWHHENAPAHLSLVVRQVWLLQIWQSFPILSTQWTSPLWFFLIPETKLKLKRRHFDNIEEILTVSQKMIETLTWNNFQKCFQSWISPWNLCNNVKGNYFEGYGGESKYR